MNIIQSPLFLEFNINAIGDLLISLQNNLQNLGINNFYSIIISNVLRILASQNRFKSQYDEIFNINRS